MSKPKYKDVIQLRPSHSGLVRLVLSELHHGPEDTEGQWPFPVSHK